MFLTAVMSFLVIPFGPGFIDPETGERTAGLVGQDLNIGLLYLFAVGGMTVVGLLMAGWSSFNKYSLLGGLRSAAQVVSYEIPLTLSVVGLILLAGTMSVNQIAIQQEGGFWNWYVFRQPLGALIFFIAATAEANRTPFDLTEADSEIVAGFATEYSGMRFGFLFFAEYVNVFIVSALHGHAVLRGVERAVPVPGDHRWAWTSAAWASPCCPARDPPADPHARCSPCRSGSRRATGRDGRRWSSASSCSTSWRWASCSASPTSSWDWVAGLVWFMVKSFLFVFLFVWMRGTLPRVRIDQLMGFAWKWLLPASLLNLFITAAAIVVVKQLSIRVTR